jgi:tetratricopeptide (TPR) repeat protein
MLFSRAQIPIPNLPQARFNTVKHLASAYFHAKRYDEAVRDQRFAAQLDPSNLESSYLLAEYEAWDGQLGEAVATQKATLQACYNTLGTVPAAYFDFMGVLEMNQDPPSVKLAQSLFSDALKAKPDDAQIAAHLAAANAYLQWAAATQPTTQSATQSTTHSTTAPTTKPIPPRDFTIFLEQAQAAAAPSTAPSTHP